MKEMSTKILSKVGAENQRARTMDMDDFIRFLDFPLNIGCITEPTNTNISNIVSACCTHSTRRGFTSPESDIIVRSCKNIQHTSRNSCKNVNKQNSLITLATLPEAACCGLVELQYSMKHIPLRLSTGSVVIKDCN